MSEQIREYVLKTIESCKSKSTRDFLNRNVDEICEVAITGKLNVRPGINGDQLNTVISDLLVAMIVKLFPDSVKLECFYKTDFEIITLALLENISGDVHFESSEDDDILDIISYDVNHPYKENIERMYIFRFDREGGLTSILESDKERDADESKRETKVILEDTLSDENTLVSALQILKSVKTEVIK